MSLNNVSLVGRLTKDPDLRYTPNGKAVANFTIAVNKIRKQQGEPDVNFINCVVWGKTAESLAQYQKKGSQIGVEGSIQTRSFEGNDGKRVYVTEVLANIVHFLEPARNNGNGQQNQGNPYQQQGNKQQGNPYQQGNQQQENPYQGQGGQNQPFDISDDDLPF